MTTELKPCPFCGGEAHVGWTDFDSGVIFVACETCGMYCEPKDCYANEPKAIEAWNNRAAYEAEGYFFLPKPKERLFYTTPLGIEETESGYRAQYGVKILEEAARRWADEIDDEIVHRIIECWNTRAERTCHKVVGKYGHRWSCSECDETLLPGYPSTRYPDGIVNYCPNCGAKVVEECTS